MEPEHKDKTLIRKYLNHNCTPEEMKEVKRLMLVPGTQQIFDELLSESWTGLEAVENTDQPHLQEKLQQFYKKLEGEEVQRFQQKEEEEGMVRSIKQRNYLRYAAILAVIFLSLGTYGILQYKKTPVEEQIAMREILNPRGQRSRIVLPDSSAVYLGAGSRITFPEQFETNSREIALEGEAFFEVTQDPKKPFIVHTGKVQTRVLGTSFKIDAFSNRPLTVAVATGKVRVDDYTGQKSKSLAILTPGQKITYDQGMVKTVATEIEEISGWKAARLVFHNQSLKEITTELERWYNVEISFEHNGKAKEKISVVLQADVPLNKIMKILAATGHFKYHITSRNVSIN
ncbi:FecR family protein [Pedobacter caeni]|uniref:FecR family protein n=1 Tax=Pedobacter caeni TaxID=288992 RepID=A0A1M5F454_9SPHI|nr:FecR family protein [Pedobacter caeni]SHF86319.1 FecR family protein [Pedobacter caeni]